MCFQGFAHWLCTHTSLYEQECALACTPFWLKVACPDYQISTRNPQQYCGTGYFYCAQTPDGIQLDHIYAAHKFAKEEIERIEELLFGEDGLRAHGQEIGNEILRNGGDKRDCERDERIRGVFREVRHWTIELEGVKVREKELHGTIERARAHFERIEKGKGSMTAVLAPGLYPPILQQGGVQRLGRRLANLHGGGGGKDLAIGRYPTGRLQQDYPSPQYHQHGQEQLSGYQAGPQPSGQTQAYQGGLHLSTTHLPVYNPPEPQASQYTPTRISQAQPLRKKHIKKQESPSVIPSQPVRRSSRVRTKNVTYVDSESDPFSRTPSPKKSDAADSNFSPSKEADLDVKPPMGRSSSLVDKIGDWQKSQMSRFLRAPLQQAPRNYLTNTTSLPRDEAKREWNVNRYDLDQKIPAQNDPSHADQEWKVNRYDADLTIPPPGRQVAQQRRNTDYNYLQKSFSVSAHLAAPRTPPHQTDSEPRKRRLPAPLPEEASSMSKKKMKLTLAGNEMFPTLTGLKPIPVLPPTAAAATPARKSNAIIVEKQQEQTGDETEEEDVEVEEENIVHVREDVVPKLEQNADVDADDDSELSDIDWDILEEGILAE